MPLRLFRVSEVQTMAATDPFTRVAKHLVHGMRQEYAIARPRPPDGKPNPYCPFLEAALAGDTVWMGAISTPIPVDIMESLSAFPAQFAALPPVEDLVNRAVVILLPNMQNSQLLEAVRLVLSMKYYIPAGLIIGALWRDIKFQGDESAEELKFTICALIVRNMVKEDRPLISRLPAPEERAAGVKKYEELFGKQA